MISKLFLLQPRKGDNHRRISDLSPLIPLSVNARPRVCVRVRVRVCTVGQFICIDLYFLFARDLTPPLFRTKRQLENFNTLHYVICVVVRKKKQRRKRKKKTYLVENEQMSKSREIVGMHYSRLRSRAILEGRRKSSPISKGKSQSQIEISDSKRIARKGGQSLKN